MLLSQPRLSSHLLIPRAIIRSVLHGSGFLILVSLKECLLLSLPPAIHGQFAKFAR